MPWKKILITASLVFLVLIVAIYIFLSTVGLNPFKPMISQVVKDVTGRELAFNGDITIRLGLTTTLTANDISFQNVQWGSRPHMATVKRVKIAIKLLPLLTKKFKFTYLTILEPDVILEVDSQGKTNLEFKLPKKSGNAGTITLPVLIFNKIEIQKGRLAYRDGRFDKTYSLNIDRLNAVIPGFDKPLKVNADGTIDDNPFSIKGSSGPILAWLENGYAFPVDLNAKAGKASFDINGEINDPKNLSNMAFNITANGPSTREIAEMAGVKATPELGAFEVKARISDTKGDLALENFDFQLGSEDLVSLVCNGGISDLISLKGLLFDFNIKGRNTANLVKSGLPELPINGPFSISGHISDPEPGIYSFSDLKVILSDNIINGQVDLNTTTDAPFMTADILSEQFDFGKLAFSGKLMDLTGTPALEVMNLQIGKEELAQLKMTGGIKDLVSQEGVEFKFVLQGRDAGNLKEIVNKPVPVKGSFKVSGEISDVEHRVFEVTPLEIVLGENRISGRVDLNLASQGPSLTAEMSAKSFNLHPLSIEGNDILSNIKNFDDLGPLDAKISVTGIAGNTAFKNFELQAGREDLVKFNINGTVTDLVKQKGIDLFFNVQGKDIANLKELVGNKIPAKGAYKFSGHITDPATKSYKIADLELKVGEANIDGWVDLKTAGQELRLISELTSDNLTLRPIDIPAIKRQNHIHDLGSMKLGIDLIRSGTSMGIQAFNFNLGSTNLIEVTLNGRVKDIPTLEGIEFDFLLQGKEAANLLKSEDKKTSFQGPFEVSGRFVEPTPKIIKLPSLKVVVGDRVSEGSIELDLTQQPPYLKVDSTSPQIDLRPFMISSDKGDAPPSEPAELEEKKEKVFSDSPWPLDAFKSLNADINIQTQNILLPRLALEDVKIGASLKDGNLAVNPIKFTIGEGPAEGDFKFDTQAQTPTLDLALKIDQLDIASMIEALGYKQASEGKVDFDINLSGSGGSIAEQMAGLNGDVTIIMVDGLTESENLNILNKYLGTDILRMLNPFDSEEPQTPINCLVTGVDIKDGLADLKIVLDTDQTTLFCAGDIDLKTEKLDLGIKPMPKKGFGTKDANISFSLNDLSQPLGLGGTLAVPSMKIDMERTLFTMGKFAGAMMLGPIGIAAFFADVSLGNADPCEVAIKRAKEGPPPEIENTVIIEDIGKD